MQSNSMMKAVMAGVLCTTLALTGCTAQWLKVALADLPVLTQMALNVAALAATLKSEQQLSPTEEAAIQSISSEAGKDLTLLQQLYDQYRANPQAGTLQKIQDVISEINQNLPGLLQSAHIGNVTLAGRITAAVNLILATVNSVSALIPHSAAVAARAAAVASASGEVPDAKELRTAWNLQVCSPSGNAGFDAALAECALK